MLAILLLVFSNSVTAQKTGRGGEGERGSDGEGRGGASSSNIGATSVDDPNGARLGS